MHPEAPYCRTTTATHSAAVDDDCAPTFLLQQWQHILSYDDGNTCHLAGADDDNLQLYTFREQQSVHPRTCN